MTMMQLAVVGAWVLAAASLVVFFYYAIPMLSRIRFVTRAEQLRDRAVDQILDGELPGEDAAVVEFIEVVEAFSRSARHLTLARVALYNAKFEKMGVATARSRPSKAKLNPAQRKVLQGLENELKVALAKHLIWGSPLGYVGYAAYMFVQTLRPRRSGSRQPLLRNDQIAAETVVHVRQDVRMASAHLAGSPARRRELVGI